MRTRSLMLEYAAKGISLALLALLAVEMLLGPLPVPWHVAVFFGVTLLSVAVVLGYAAAVMLRQGHRVKGRVLAFLLFLVLENPVLVYAGVLAGLLIATGVVSALAGWEWWHPLAAIGGGLVLGTLFAVLRQVPNRWARTGTVLIVMAGIAAAIFFWLRSMSDTFDPGRQHLFAYCLLLGIPLFYLLTLAGQAEETEMEIGSLCVVLGLALGMVTTEQTQILAFVLPPAVYFVYTQWVMNHLQVFKHVLRGLSYHNLGKHREALLAYRRALQLNPRHQGAQEGRWHVHRDLDLTHLANDPKLMALVNLDLCLDRVRDLLLQSKPSPERLTEAQKLLDLVVGQRPEMEPAVMYWRAVAFAHARDLDQAERCVRAILDETQYGPNDAYRKSVLLPCWQLVLMQHQELKKRVGIPLLVNEKRRLDAIATVEESLVEAPDDSSALELKQQLYADLTEAEYRQAAGSNPALPATKFDHEYCLQRGMLLIGDQELWQRGGEFLRMAAAGLPQRAPAIYTFIAQACERAGEEAGARHNYDILKRLVREVGVKNLSDEDRQAYVATLRRLGDKAHASGDVPAAIENFTLYVESGQGGVDTIRLLTDLHEKRGDPLQALIWNERALLYDGKDKELLDRRDRYYYSVMPEQLQASAEQISKLFDVQYCLRKAKSLLDLKHGGPEQVDWAMHLAELARIVQPDSVLAMVLCARGRLRRDEREQAVPLLEAARAARTEAGFATAEDEDAWFLSCRLLGDLYLQHLNRPDLAVACYGDYRKTTKSGVDTLYKMGQAYELLGDQGKAAKCYQNVAAYDHPLAYDARMALSRLGVNA